MHDATPTRLLMIPLKNINNTNIVLPVLLTKYLYLSTMLRYNIYLLLPYMEPIGACHTFNFKIQQPGSGFTNEHGLWEAALNEMLQWKRLLLRRSESWPKLCGHQLAQGLFTYKSHPTSPPPQTMLMP